MASDPRGFPLDGTARDRRRIAATAGAILTALASAGVALSALVGPVWIDPSTVWAILLHQLSGGTLGSPCGPSGGSGVVCVRLTEVVWDARMPAILVAILAGAALAVSGGTLQGAFRNPLCDPFLLGLSSGAAMGAATLFTFGIDLSQQAALLPLFAFLGALVPGLAVYAAARAPRRSSETLVLTGVALSALFSALLATFLFYNPSAGLQVSFWLLGNLQDESWARVGVLAGVLLVVGTLLSLHGRELNILQLGPEVAESVGVEASRTTRRLILLSTVGTAVAVAFTGVIGFVGLVSPHVVRRWIGPDYRTLLPVAALFGALFLLVASDVAQEVIPAVVLPVGIPTSFVGAPFFLYLLYRRRSF